MKKKSLYITSLLVLVNVWTAHAGVQGALPGAFSVSATKKVYFSQGNLQYQASTNTWRFAASQYTRIGVGGNNNISPTYTGWIDWFGWGTGSNPTNTSTNNSSYTFTDWGVNKISNGGNQANLWRTLTKAEWEYLLSGRANATNRRSTATVNNVKGYIFLPDSWTLPSGLKFVADVKNKWDTNKYSLEDWQKMEQNGAIFLPKTASISKDVNTGQPTYYDAGWAGDEHCHYWASTQESSTKAYMFSSNISTYYSSYSVSISSSEKRDRRGVRLVIDSDKNVAYTITWKNWDGTTLATTSVLKGATPSYTGSTPTRPSTAEYAYTFSGWTPAITAATADKTYTATYTATPRYTITFNANGGLIPTDGNMGNTPSGHITTLSTDRTSGTVVVTKDKTHFQTMTNDCPSREGYTFAGWYTDPTAGVQVYDNTGYRVVGTYWNSEGKWIATSNVTLYAHWSNVTYTITFVDVNENTIGVPQMVEYGQDAIPPAAPTREGYTFAGWIGKYTNVQADAKVYASYYHNHLPSTPHGALDGWFPISDSTEVQFAQGNLQYNAVVGTHMCADASSKLGVWRFGELQYDTISHVNNKNGSATYKNWIDQFGFGTSGWQSDATAYQPYAQSTNNANYIQHSLTDAYVYADWGVYNSIFNGGNTPELWRTPTYQELDYLIAHAKEENRIGVACIEHTYAGLVLLPSQFVLPAGLTFNAQMRVEEIDIVEAFDNINSYTASQWAKLENNGAIFLQFQESKARSSSEPLNWLLYMSSTERDANTNYVISCDGGRSISVNGKNKNKYEGFSIRLVSAQKRMRQYLITLTSTDNIKGTATGGGTYDYGTNHQITATPSECYRFVQWSDGNTDNPRTITVTGDATYTAEFEQMQYSIEAQSADAGQGSATVTNP